MAPAPSVSNPAVVILSPKERKPLNAGRVRGDISAFTGVTSDVRDIRMLPSGIILILCATLVTLKKALLVNQVDGTPCTARLSKRPFNAPPKPRANLRNVSPTSKGVIYRIPLTTPTTNLTSINNVKNASRMYNKTNKNTTSILLEFNSSTLPREVVFNQITYPVTRFNAPRTQQQHRQKQTKTSTGPETHIKPSYTNTTNTLLYSDIVRNKHTETTKTQPKHTGVYVTAEFLGKFLLIARDTHITDREAIHKVRDLINKQNGHVTADSTPINTPTQSTPKSTQTTPTTQPSPPTTPILFTQTTPQTQTTETETQTETPSEHFIHLLDSSEELDSSTISKPRTPRTPVGMGRYKTLQTDKTPTNKQQTPSRPNTRSRAKQTNTPTRTGHSKRKLQYRNY
ncbi:mucin-2-like [Pecten maximus]|uniref:mucin-2-like n=1 Tax=Pecten maximus TaxID=6579 RepID=UPI0014586FA3|nr:mucin-2-like [Pecten maximus]